MRTEPADHPIKRSRHTHKAEGAETCVLCGAAIERFDVEIFILTGRCAPCHEALDQD